MANNDIALVGLAIGLDTTKFRREVEYTQRLLNQSTSAFRDLETTVKLLDKAMEQQLVTEQAATAAKNKAILADERRQATLRREAQAVAELAAEQERQARVVKDSANDGLLTRQARQGSRSAFLDALDAELAATERLKKAQAEQTAEQERAKATLRTEGVEYLRQFETAQQLVNRQLAEATAQFKRGAITASEYATATRSIRRANSELAQSFGQIKGLLVGVIGPTVLAFKAFEGLKKSILGAAELSAAEARFRVFTQSAGRASQLVADLRQLSATSPVSFSGGAAAASTLLQFGVEAKEIKRTLSELAEITGGDTERLKQLALAFSQMQAAGRLMGQELLQMINAGFNPLQLIAEQTGQTLPELKKQMEAGAISAEQVAKAFTDATTEGGKFNGLLREVAETTSGKLAKSRAELEGLAISFGELIKPATDGTLNLLIEDLERMRRTLELINGLRLQGSGKDGPSALLNLATFNPELEAIKTPSYIEDLVNAYFVADKETSVFAQQIRDKAESIIRLGEGRLSFLLPDGALEDARRYSTELERLEGIVAKLQKGEQVDVAAKDQANVDELSRILKEQDRQALLTDQRDFNRLRNKYDEAQKLVGSIDEARKLEIELVELVGKGFFSDAELANVEQWKKEIEASASAAKELQRVEDAFSKAQEAAKGDLIDARYGADAERVQLLLSQSVADERKKLDDLIAQGAAYDKILASANAVAQAEASRLAAMESQATNAEREAEQAKALADLASQAKYLQEIVALGEEQARITQLVRDDGLNQVEAELQQAAEARLAAEVKIAELRKQAQDLTTDSTAFDKLVNSLSELQQLSQLGFLKDSVFSREQAKLFDSATKQTDASAPRAIQAGSSEAFALQANAQAKLVSEQIRLADRAFLVQKAIAEASKKTAKVLDEVKDNLGALPTP